MEAPNYGRLSEGLKIFRDRSLDFVVTELKDAYGRLHWWDHGVARHFKGEELENLSRLFETHGSKLAVLSPPSDELWEMLGINHLRNIILGNWRDVFEPKLKDRDTISAWLKEVGDARNLWAHPGSGDVLSADATRLLDTCARVTALFDQECSRRLETLRDSGTRAPPPPEPRIGKSHEPSRYPFDKRAEIRAVFERAIRQSAAPQFELEDSNLTYTHFAPLSWDHLIPRAGSRKSRRVLSFMIENKPSYLRLFLEICPGDQAVRARIFDAVRRSPLFKPPNQLSPQWCRVFRRDILTLLDYERLDMIQIEKRIEDAFREFREVTFKQIDAEVSLIKFL